MGQVYLCAGMSCRSRTNGTEGESSMTTTFEFNLAALLACTVMLALAAGTLLMCSAVDQRRPAFLTSWTWFCWCAAFTGTLYLLRGIVPDLLVIAASNSVLLLAWSLLWAGARLLRGAVVARVALIVPSLLWLGACGFAVFRTTLALREIVLFLMLSGLSAGTTIELLLLRKSGQTRLCARALAVMGAVYGVSIVWRAVSVASMAAGSVKGMDGIAVILTAVFINITGFAGLAVASSLAAAREAANLSAAESRLNLLVQDGPGVLFQARKSGDGWYKTYVSPNVSALTGYPTSHYVGPAPERSLGTDAAGQAAWAVALERAQTTGSSTCDFATAHKSGQILWARANFKLRIDAGGDPLLTGYMVDISSERALTEALETARADLEQAVAMGPGCLYRVRLRADGARQTDYLSDSAERIYGYTKTEMADPAWFASVLDPAHVPLLTEQVQRLLRRESTISEYRLRTKSGGWIRIADTLNPNPQSEPDGSVRAVGFATDVTALKVRTAQLEHAARLAVLGEMATGVAHELRQPLGGISFAAQNAEFALEAGNLDSVRIRLGRIIEQTRRADGIIEHLRMFGRGSDPDGPAVAVSLEAVMQGTLGLFGETLRLDSIAITWALGQPALSILGDQTRLEQVLINLLMNARDALLEHCPDSRTRRIRVAAECVKDIVSLTIADNGGGIPADLLPRVFQPFVTTKLATKGTGLGLSICREIISKMGGDISVRNDEAGAVFTITLPVAA